LTAFELHRFFSLPLLILSPHYGTEFRIEVVDAATDKALGIVLLTVQALLQGQRDSVVQQRGIALMSFLHAPGKFEGKKHLVYELRTGFKAGFSSEFYSTTKARSEKEGEPRPGMFYVVDYCFVFRRH